MKKSAILWFMLLPSVCLSQHSFSDFEPDNIGEAINTKYHEAFPMILSDGLTLFFSSNRPGGYGDLDIYVTTRKSESDPWAEPINLGPVINSGSSDHSVTVSEDRHWMIFTSNREGGSGQNDLYISYREDISDPTGWEKPKNVGSPASSSMSEACPLFHKEGNQIKLYFIRPESAGLSNLYVSTMSSINKFNQPVSLEQLSSPEGDFHFDPGSGLIWSNRKGGEGESDLWITTERIDEFTWAKPINLGTNINTSYSEGMPSVTHDGSLLIFHSNRPEGFGEMDIYFARN